MNHALQYTQLKFKLDPLMNQRFWVRSPVESPICGPYPIHGPARLAFKWKENVKRNEKKMWVDFRVLENLSPRRNGFALESPLTFIFIFKWGKSSKKKKPNDSIMEKNGMRKLDFWVRGSDYLSER